MPTYLYRCPLCGDHEEHQALLAPGNRCEQCGAGCLVRDYRAEGVNVNTTNLRKARS